MSNIILDSLTLDTSLQFLEIVGKGNLNSTQKECFNNFLTGIILWDTLSFPSSVVIDNIFKKLEGDSLTRDLRNIIVPLDTSILESSSFILIDYGFGNSDEELDNLLVQWRKGIFTDDDKILLTRRTNKYFEVSSLSGANYYPHPIRADYLIQNEQRNTHNREALLRRLEKNITEYSEGCAVHFNTSILYDYIKKEAGEAPREQLIYALKLRNEKDVVAFRKSLDKFEKKYSPGTINNEKISHKEIDEITNEIFNKYNQNRSKRVSVDISANYGICGPGIGMNIKNLSVPFSRRNTLDKNFIYRLLMFGLNERR